MAIDWNQVYSDYRTELGDDSKALEYTIYGRLTGRKTVPPTAYSKEQWVEFEAPDYNAAVSYQGDDALANFTRNELKNAKSINSLLTTAKKAANEGLLQGTSFTQFDYYNELKDLWNQKTTAEKRYKTQQDTAWWTDYALPAPSERFDSANNTFDVAETYIANQTAAYSKKLGNDPNKASRTKAYNESLRSSLYQRLNDSNITPFLVAAQKRAKTIR
jgi:hypothetical protein